VGRGHSGPATIARIPSWHYHARRSFEHLTPGVRHQFSQRQNPALLGLAAGGRGGGRPSRKAPPPAHTRGPPAWIRPSTGRIGLLGRQPGTNAVGIRTGARKGPISIRAVGFGCCWPTGTKSRPAAAGDVCCGARAGAAPRRAQSSPWGHGRASTKTPVEKSHRPRRRAVTRAGGAGKLNGNASACHPRSRPRLQ